MPSIAPGGRRRVDTQRDASGGVPRGRRTRPILLTASGPGLGRTDGVISTVSWRPNAVLSECHRATAWPAVLQRSFSKDGRPLRQAARSTRATGVSGSAMGGCSATYRWIDRVHKPRHPSMARGRLGVHLECGQLEAAASHGAAEYFVSGEIAGQEPQHHWVHVFACRRGWRR
jgi:hypothetical protein